MTVKDLMEKCGLKRDGLLRSAVYAKGEMKDVHLAAITSEDYFNTAYTSDANCPRSSR